MPPTATITNTERQDLLAIIKQIQGVKIKLNAVAAGTGINYKAFLNKIKDLELRQAGKASTFRNSFTAKDYQTIKTWWTDYKAKLAAM